MVKPAFGGKTGALANPNGRPKEKTISEHLRDLYAMDKAKVQELIDFLEGRIALKRSLGPVTNARLIAARMILQARSGDMETIKELLNRVEGKVKDKLEVTVPEIIFEEKL